MAAPWSTMPTSPPAAGLSSWPAAAVSRPAPGASSAAWSVCSMARAGTAAAGSGGVTGAAGVLFMMTVWGHHRGLSEDWLELGRIEQEKV